jgi:hypothetical protein
LVFNDSLLFLFLRATQALHNLQTCAGGVANLLQ